MYRKRLLVLCVLAATLGCSCAKIETELPIKSNVDNPLKLLPFHWKQ